MTAEKVSHYIQRARVAKHYVIRAKRDGYPTIAAEYRAERVECMAKARRAALEAAQ